MYFCGSQKRVSFFGAMGSGNSRLSNTFLKFSKMQKIQLKGTAREIGTKQSLKQLRKNQEVPCVIYGPGVENVNFSLNEKDLKAITHTPKSFIIDIEVNGANHLCVFHQAQFHPISDETMHVDFLAVSADRPVVIDIPLNIHGNSEGVKQGGKLMVSSRKLKISEIGRAHV